MSHRCLQIHFLKMTKIFRTTETLGAESYTCTHEATQARNPESKQRLPALSPVGPTSSLLASDLYYRLSFEEPTDHFLSVGRMTKKLILHTAYVFFSSFVSY